MALALMAVIALACAVAGAGCSASHGCSDVYYSCSQTTITVQAPNGAWAAGTYAVAVTVDGTPQQCTIVVPDDPPSSGVQGTCGQAGGATVSLVQVESCPAPACYNSVCTVTSCTPVDGHFTLNVTAPTVASKVSLQISLGGAALGDETITPAAMTSEPNGEGCGTCTNASATVSLSDQ